MIRISCLLIALLLFAACDRSKPKPMSNNISKTNVTVNGKKDSVINNPQKRYGNATIAEPCVKCLLQVIQNSESYKNATQSVKHNDIIYTVGWVSKKIKNIGNDSIGNGMQVDVIQKADSQQISLSTYLYDNSNSKLYLLNKKMKYEAEPLIIDSMSLKKIRNSCFWGVASE